MYMCQSRYMHMYMFVVVEGLWLDCKITTMSQSIFKNKLILQKHKNWELILSVRQGPRITTATKK